MNSFISLNKCIELQKKRIHIQGSEKWQSSYIAHINCSNCCSVHHIARSIYKQEKGKVFQYIRTKIKMTVSPFLLNLQIFRGSWFDSKSGCVKITKLKFAWFTSTKEALLLIRAITLCRNIRCMNFCLDIDEKCHTLQCSTFPRCKV